MDKQGAILCLKNIYPSGQCVLGIITVTWKYHISYINSSSPSPRTALSYKVHMAHLGLPCSLHWVKDQLMSRPPTLTSTHSHLNTREVHGIGEPSWCLRKPWQVNGVRATNLWSSPPAPTTTTRNLWAGCQFISATKTIFESVIKYLWCLQVQAVHLFPYRNTFSGLVCEAMLTGFPLHLSWDLSFWFISIPLQVLMCTHAKPLIPGQFLVVYVKNKTSLSQTKHR